MRHFDLSPLYRSTVGFDKLFSLLDAANVGETAAPSYPPYNIERFDENSYRITMAVAGFREADLDIEVKENALTIRGEHAESENAQRGEILHQGIAARAFERRLRLAGRGHGTNGHGSLLWVRLPPIWIAAPLLSSPRPARQRTGAVQCASLAPAARV